MAKSESRKIKGRLILETYGYWIPGRLYLNNELVEVRSALEREIVNKLQKAKIKPKNPDDFGYQTFWQWLFRRPSKSEEMFDVPTINWYRHKIINAVNSHKYVVLSILIQRKFSRKHS